MTALERPQDQIQEDQWSCKRSSNNWSGMYKLTSAGLILTWLLTLKIAFLTVRYILSTEELSVAFSHFTVSQEV